MVQSKGKVLRRTTTQNHKVKVLMPRKLMHGPERRTHPVVWCVAMVCTVIAIGVILTGLVVFVAYLVIHPSFPVVRVSGAYLDPIQSNAEGLLRIQMTIVVRAENRNAKAHSSFSDTAFVLSFEGVPVAKLVADPFEVPKNDTVELPYRVVSGGIPLSATEMEQVDRALKQDRITFQLRGHSRSRWRVGLIGSVRFWCDLNCRLSFHPSNGSFINSPPCSSKSS